jgi:hypothetical protein
MPRALATAILTGLSSLVAQTLPTPLPADLEALAQRVERAHHPGGKTAPVTAFRGSLELELIAADAAQSGRVDLSVAFLQWRRPGSDKVRPLIRYELAQAGEPVVRGRDQNGYWHLFQGVPRDLAGSEFPQDRAACERDTNLARQLLRFLAPGDVLRGLVNPTPTKDEDLRLGRETPTPCTTVEGQLTAFPLLQRGGEDAPVVLKVWITRADGHLFAIEAWPLEQGHKVDTGGELVRLLDLLEQDGLLVPRKMEHFYRLPDGKLKVQWRTLVTQLTLRPELTAADFDRPKPAPK